VGDRNQLLFVQRNADLLRGPILEVGSRDYGSTPDFRALFPGAQYVGVDQSAGAGVDVVLDLTAEFAAVDACLGGRRFSTVLCFSVLEHCAQPFRMADNLTNLTASGGHLLVGVPFSWELHAYPSDYWRFTADGVRALFPAFAFDAERSVMATSETGQMRPIEPSMYRAELSVSAARRRGDYGRLRGLLVRTIRRLGLLPFIFDYRYLHPPVMLNMIGRKIDNHDHRKIDHRGHQGHQGGAVVTGTLP
jgi:hypothetical protein